MGAIYLDYNATTPVDPAVAEAMHPYIALHYGNPSSAHVYGRATKDAVEEARRQVAGLLGCAAEEVIFTGGGSESNNTVLKGAAYTYRHRGDHIITSQVEHPATINPCQFLERQGLRVTYLPVHHATDDPHQYHARQQRSRHAPTDRRDQSHRPGSRRARPYRCRAIRRKSPDVSR
jgi:cysteine sulfinate desulfinase/cysteine desulfurase-like protein